MGGASTRWYSSEKRKVLIMSYEDKYISQLSRCLLKKEVSINEYIGFVNEQFFYNELEYRLWFLTCKNRHLWRHHYFGAQGVILVFSFKDKRKGEQLIMDALNIVSDSTLKPIPILILFDTSNKEMSELNEEFRKRVNALDKELINFQNINLENKTADLALGLDWLSEVMKPI